ncbi:MAG: hypothetical protein PVJ19_16435 [Desulfobacteraceae bacterium]
MPPPKGGKKGGALDFLPWITAWNHRVGSYPHRKATIHKQTPLSGEKFPNRQYN